ncbi:2Fe-2S iron-sulfur cluster binding domain-containing protein [Roseibium salinum]|nr:2Fe-2S iron-sulfur cluster binding domain-containing protein [Roseibium salinum]
MDAGLGGRLVLPHDCCSGQCETCRVRVLSGGVDDLGTREKDTVLGCLAVLEGDAEISYDPVPIVKTTKGVVESIREVKEDYLEIRVRVARPVTWLPGQYLRATFAGYPPRDYSPTTPLNLDAEQDVIVFHIKVYPDSIVSSKLGKEIGKGHAVKLRGPFGNAFLRRQPEPIILTSTGTGFAPIWSIAVAASMGQPKRELKLVVGSRARDGLYMRDAVRWLRHRGIAITLTASDGDDDTVMTARPHELVGDITEKPHRLFRRCPLACGNHARTGTAGRRDLLRRSILCRRGRQGRSGIRRLPVPEGGGAVHDGDSRLGFFELTKLNVTVKPEPAPDPDPAHRASRNGA